MACSDATSPSTSARPSRNEAAKRAADLFGIDIDVRYSNELLPGQAGSTDSKTGLVEVGPAAFDDPGMLVSTLLHEEVHVSQRQSGNWGRSQINEVEAYDVELSNAGRLKLSSEQIVDIQTVRNRYFNELDAGYKAQVRRGDYRTRASDL